MLGAVMALGPEGSGHLGAEVRGFEIQGFSFRGFRGDGRAHGAFFHRAAVPGIWCFGFFCAVV